MMKGVVWCVCNYDYRLSMKRGSSMVCVCNYDNRLSMLDIWLENKCLLCSE